MAEPAKAAGMPQLDFSTFPNQIFWLVVAIVVLYYILSRIALPRIASVMAERAGTITNDLAAAEQLKEQAKQAEAAYNRALEEARAQAQKIIAQTQAEIQSELEAALARADAEIAARRAAAEERIAEIRADANKTVALIARELTADIVRLFEVEPDPARIESAIKARLPAG